MSYPDLDVRYSGPSPTPSDPYHNIPVVGPAYVDGVSPVALESEIYRAIHNLALLQQRRYSFLPIASLPPELLINVFREASLASSKDRATQPRGKNAVVTISHVCHYWRKLALNTPSLWADLDDRVLGTDMAMTMANRSSTLPLTISTHGKREAVGQALLLASKHAWRLRSLIIAQDVYEYSTSRTLPPRPNMLRDLPLLERLIIKPQVATGHLVLGKLPRARSIELRGVSFSWSDTVNSLHCLTNLSLSTIPSLTRYGPDQLLHLLARTPALQSLHLDSVFSGCLPSAVDGDGFTVALPSLQRFTLMDLRPEACAAFLRRLVLPVGVRFRHTLSSIWDDVRCLPLCAALAESLDAVRKTSTWVSTEMNVQLSPPMIKIKASSSLSPAEDDWSAMVELPFQKQEGFQTQLASVLGDSVSTIRVVTLYHSYWMLPGWVCDALRTLVSAETLKIHFHTTNALQDDCHNSTAGLTPPVLPALKRLEIQWTANDYAVRSHKLTTVNVDLLSSVIASRNSLGSSIETLCVNKFNQMSGSPELSRLASLVPALFVDDEQIHI